MFRPFVVAGVYLHVWRSNFSLESFQKVSDVPLPHGASLFDQVTQDEVV